jgi:hypothetical protein
MHRGESVGIITWQAGDGRRFQVWPTEYRRDEIITVEGRHGSSRMWMYKVIRGERVKLRIPEKTRK